jgi:ubiquinone/menaquinone biosynthesis C-methylase UbiE
MKENKNHWYDGLFYDKLIAPNQDRLFSQIKNLIEPNSKIIDIGCGTGRFAFSIHEKCESVLGIDLSKRNIDRANFLLSKNPQNRITFKHTSLNEIISNVTNHFDYAVMTYVLHEVNENERVELLKNVSQLASKIIIGDYHPKQTNRFWRWLNEIVEFAAGKEHYRNYKNYISNGGLKTLAEKAELKIISEIKDRPLTSHSVILSRK